MRKISLRLVGVVWLMMAYFPTISQHHGTNTYTVLARIDSSEFQRFDSLRAVDDPLTQVTDKIINTDIRKVKTESSEISIEDEIRRLNSIYADIYFQPDFDYVLVVNPDDSLFQQQAYLHNEGQNDCTSGIDINIGEAWGITTGDDEIVIAVIDGGIDLTHEDLENNLYYNPGEMGIDDNGMDKSSNEIDDDGNGFVDDWRGWDFEGDIDQDDNLLPKEGGENPEDDTSNGHGTHVSGIIGAEGNNRRGIAGVCWNCKILPLKFTNEDGRGTTATAIEAIEYAIYMKEQGVNIPVINASWGGGSPDPLLLESIMRADTAGILFVAAAGNIPENNNDSSAFHPASYVVNNIISVAAMTCQGILAEFSCYGPSSVDVAAPGEGAYSALAIDNENGEDTYGILSGTSMAAPQVSGTIALMASYIKNNNLTGIDHLDLKNYLLNAARSNPNLMGKCLTGAYLDVKRALLSLPTINRDIVSDIPPNAFSVISDVNGATIWVGTQYGNSAALIRIDPITQEKDTFVCPVDLSSAGMGKTIALDPIGNIWILFAKAVYLYNPEQEPWELVLTASDFDRFSNIAISSTGKIWIDAGAYKMLTSTVENAGEWENLWLHTLGESEIILYDVQSMQAGADDELYLIVDSMRYNWGGQNPQMEEGTLLIKYENGMIAHMNGTGDNLATDNMKLPILKTPQEHLWIGNLKADLLHFDGENWEEYDLADLELPVEPIKSMNIDQNGHLWLINDKTGLIEFDSTNWIFHENLFSENSLPMNPVHDMTTDLFGNVWIALDTLNMSQEVATVITKFSIPTFASFSVDDHMICKNDSLYFQNTSLGAENFDWTITKLFPPENTDPIYLTSQNRDIGYAFEDSGFYKVELIASYEDTAFQYIFVQGPIEIDLGVDTTSLADSVYLNPDIPPMVSYTWTRDQSNIIIGTKKDHTASDSDTFTLTARDDCENTNIGSININFNGNQAYVIPGDVNRDGKYNALDILLLATVEGKMGANRDITLDSQTDYDIIPLAAEEDWNNNSGPELPHDLRMVDPNGDGVINLTTDAEFTIVHANSVHPKSEIDNESGLYLEMEVAHLQGNDTDPENIAPDTVDIIFYLSGDFEVMNEVYGIAFSVDLNYALKDPSFTLFDYPESSMRLWTSNLNIYRNFIYDTTQHRFDFMFTRTDPGGPNPNSPLERRAIARGCTISIIDDIDTNTADASSAPLTFTLSNVLLIDSTGARFTVNEIFSQSVHTVISDVSPPGNEEERISPPNSFPQEQLSMFNTYPNPNQGLFKTEINLEYPVELYGELFDLTGRRVKVYQAYLQAGRHQVPWNIADLPRGVYVLLYRSRNNPAIFHHEKIRLD